MAGKIVVGLDGTEESVGALRWAAAEAVLRGAVLQAVHAWSFTPVAAPADAGLVPLAWNDSAGLFEASQDAARQLTEAQLTAVLGEDHGAVVSVVQDEPTSALLAAAEDADLLVVGNRGRGSFAQALLGSTSAKVSDKAHCPVVVVRATSD